MFTLSIHINYTHVDLWIKQHNIAVYRFGVAVSPLRPYGAKLVQHLEEFVQDILLKKCDEKDAFTCFNKAYS